MENIKVRCVENIKVRCVECQDLFFPVLCQPLSAVYFLVHLTSVSRWP